MKSDFFMRNIFRSLSILIIVFSTLPIFSQEEIRYSRQLKKYGIKNKKTDAWVLQPVYDNIQPVFFGYSGDFPFYVVKKGTKSYLMEQKGKRIVSPAFEKMERNYAQPFMFVVVANNKRFILIPEKPLITFENDYFYDRIGKSSALFRVFKSNTKEIQLFNWRTNKIYPEIYDSVYYSDGLIFVKNKKWGIINEEGGQLLPYMFESFFYNDKLLIAQKENKWGILDSSLSIKLPFEFDSISRFVTFDRDEKISNYYVKKNGLCAILDHDLKSILDFKYEDIKVNYSFADLFKQHCWMVKQNGRWGVTDKNNQWLIPCKYEWVFPDNLIGVPQSDVGNLVKWDTIGTIPVILNKKMGLLNLSGKEIFPFKYDYCQRVDRYFNSPANDKTFLVNDGCVVDQDGEIHGGKWGLADSAGKIILPVEAEIAPVFRWKAIDGSSPMDSTFFGFVWNIGGKKLLAYDSVYYEANEYFDDQGNELFYDVPKKYFSHLCSNNFFKGGLFGLSSRTGEMLIPAVYEDMRLPLNSRGHHCGYRDYNETVLHISITDSTNIPFNKPYGYFADGSYPVFAKKKGKWGALSWTGNSVVPFEHDSISFEANPYAGTDSAALSKKLPSNFIRTYHGKNYGFYSADGKKLCENSIEREIPVGTLRRYDSAGGKNFVDDGNTWSIVIRDIIDSVYDAYRTEFSYFDEYNFEETRPVVKKTEFSFPVKAKYNIKDDSRQLLVNKEWYEDIMLIHTSGNPFYPVCFSDRVKMEFDYLSLDSLLDKRGKKIYGIGDRHYNSKDSRDYWVSFFDYCFVKRSGKWYLNNIHQQNSINENYGFDSVAIISGSPYYKAYNGNSYANYDFSYRGPFNQHADAFFPDTIHTMKIAYRGKDIQYRNYPYEEKQILFDSEGQERDTLIIKTISLPIVKQGKFNVIQQNGTVLLKDWADQIVFPKNEKNEHLSISDESSFIYKKENALSFKNINTHFSSIKSMAVKYGEDWFLIGIADGAKTGPFKEVNQEGEKWVCRKKKSRLIIL